MGRAPLNERADRVSTSGESPGRECLHEGILTQGAFDRVFSSAILGAAKPAPAVYRAVAATMGVRPERVFFTDDEMLRVHGARQRLGAAREAA